MPRYKARVKFNVSLKIDFCRALLILLLLKQFVLG
ncbi:hypothetical protein EV213_11413 [Aureibacillus halotolerans]|uniref:Uncharacterized protein n=1 Tax=Aureibacillus halotolerans TaxID=1508390 RepID=A0A4R6U212_9BACI|nr:hypothetical protein EV213_11413 [Aureibacillus halotolerans]